MRLRRLLSSRRRKWLAAAAMSGALLVSGPAMAFESLGVGTDALIGGDLTDPEDDGDPEADFGYNAIFDSSDEQGFAGGEFAFNVFDNVLGPSNDKWCCGMAGGIDEDNPAWVSAELPARYLLTGFTVSSANDVIERDPTWWAVQGSNDGDDWTTIFEQEDDIGLWEERLEVLSFTAGDDFPEQTEAANQAYNFFRMATFNTQNNPNGAYFQIGEIEFFGDRVGEEIPRYAGGEGTIGVESQPGTVTNRVYEGSAEPNSPGWGVRLAADSGVTINNHTIAEEVLDNAIAEGEIDFEAYEAVDLGGGDGTFFDTEAYPNGVDVGDTSMEDFAVRAEAEVVIPPGTYTVGIGSDDGGQISIPGVEFEASQNNGSSDPEAIRFEGNRGHGWTVGSFTVEEELSTVIITSMHERGGGDSMEIAIIDEELIENASPDTGWELLADGVFGWQLSHDPNPLVLVSADSASRVPGGDRPWEIDVNGDTGASDQFEVADADGLSTVLAVDGVNITVNPTGNVANGQSFRVFNADTIVGTPTILTDGWDYNDGFVCFGSCPNNLGGGDYNGDGTVDVADLDLQAEAIAAAEPDLAKFDEDNDGDVDVDDRNFWLKNYALNGQGTWMGDADLNGEFDSSDFVTVFTVGKYESGEAATWGEGDWNGDGLFSSADFVTAFSDGGYNQGPIAATAAVPEPSSALLALLSFVGLVGLGRRR